MPICCACYNLGVVRDEYCLSQYFHRWYVARRIIIESFHVIFLAPKDNTSLSSCRELSVIVRVKPNKELVILNATIEFISQQARL